MLTPYRPQSYVDFDQPEPRQKMLDALAGVRAQLGRTWPLRIGGQKINTDKTIASLAPANYSTVVGYVGKATRDHAEQAIRTAAETFKAWRYVDPSVRARVLLKAAAIMERRVYELAAWMCFEESKSWIEAYADACEAIDFLSFYGREMMRLGGAQPVSPYPGEENELRYIPLGVGVVIPPWNFPLAICTGMTSAAIVTGNTVVLKPASASPVIAAIMAEIFEDAGLPPGVLNYCPGSGGEVGDHIVDHPLTRFVAFTGSMEIGLRIFERCGKLAPGQIWLKRTILEMGGKDCILVDETADLEAAAEGIVAAAFGFQGQKCSACSRAILHQDVYDAVLTKVVERTKKLTIGDTTGPEDYCMGAVIDEAAYKTINDYIRVGMQEGRLVAGGPSDQNPDRRGGAASRHEGTEARRHEGAGIQNTDRKGGAIPGPTAREGAIGGPTAREGAIGGPTAREGVLVPAGGYFIPPTIIEGVDRNARIAQEEIFGPVLAVIKARDFDDGLDIANGTKFGLTGALYSKDRFRLERARHEFHCGNLYLNRKCTGALVDVQPFGGFNMSGTDSKAGGRDYLLLFMQGKSITEKL